MSVLPAAIRVLPERGYRLSVATYHRMIADGTLDENDPVELIEGELLFKVPKNKAHIQATNRLNAWFARVLASGWTVQGRDPVTFSDSDPEPDAACVTQASMDRPDDKAGPEDIGLVVEVSDSTLGYDRSRKLRMYARAGIVEYWIVNLIDRQIEIYTQPDAAAAEPNFGSRVVRKAGEPITLPAALGGASIDVAALLPPA